MTTPWMNFRSDFEVVATKKTGSTAHIMKAMSAQFNDQEMSDLELKVGNRTFYVHKFVLSLLSDVFRTMCSKRWEGDRSVLQIQECEECIPVFESFLKYLYSGDVDINVSNALSFLMLADKYNVCPLKEMLENFMKDSVINDGSITGALRWFVYSQISGHTALQFSCVDVIISKMDDVIGCDDFLDLEIGFLVALLGRDDLVVLWEKALYDAVLRWIEAHGEVTSDEILILMKLIRFSMMLPEQLFAIESSRFFSSHDVIMSPIINNAHRFRSLATNIYDMPAFSDPIFRPRNYTHRLWCHYITIETNGDSFFQDTIGVQCVNHPVVSVTDQFWRVKVLGEKRLSGNLNFSKPTMIPNLGCIMTPHVASTFVKPIPLTLIITPLRPIKQDVVVDISLYQVKKDKLSKYLCGKSLKFFSGDCLHDSDDSAQASGPFRSPFYGSSKFNSPPINISVKSQRTQMSDKPEIGLRYDFISHDFDHPAEYPCFKLNGPRRSTDSIRVALIFKPRFLPFPIKDEEKPNQTNEELRPIQIKTSGDTDLSKKFADKDDV